MITEPTRCPCGLDAAFTACCQPYLAGWDTPRTAEALMRSRYSAYAVEDVDYLGKTSGGEALAEFSPRSALAWARSATFTRLEVKRTELGAETDTTGVVEFAATYLENGKTHVVAERSRFERAMAGDPSTPWRYVGREKVAPVKASPKAGRNDPCPCGSGQKYKKCCGA
jgi:SEC-C motif-containing protein